MAIVQFSIGASRTINLGNFESLRIESSVTVDVAEGDDLASVENIAQDELRKLLELTYRRQYKRVEPSL